MDDTQIYISCYPSSLIDTVNIISNAYFIITLWVSSSLLKINNDNKTKVLVVGSAVVARYKAIVPTPNLGGYIITYFECVKNDGATFDSSLSCKGH